MYLESTQSSDCSDWTDSKTLKLIDLFRQHECPWKVNTADFLTVAAAIIAAAVATTKSSDITIQHGPSMATSCIFRWPFSRLISTHVTTVTCPHTVDSVDSTGDIKSKSMLSPVCTRSKASQEALASPSS